MDSRSRPIALPGGHGADTVAAIHERGSRRLDLCARANGPVVLFAGLMAANMGNFVFHVMESRLLGAASYGAVSSILNLLLALSLPAGALQVLVVREIAVRRGAPVAACALLGRACGVASVGALTIALFAGRISGYLHVGSPASILLVAGYLVLCVGNTVLRGTLLGRLRFAPVAAAAVLGSTVQVIGAWRLVSIGVTGAMVAVVAGEIVTSVVLVISGRQELRRDGAPVGVSVRRTARATTALLGFWLLAGSDVIFARHFLSPVGAGHYAAAAFLARLVLFVLATVASAAVPNFADPDRNRANAALRATLRLSVAFGVGAAGVVIAGSGLFVRAIFGRGYAATPSVVVPLVAAACALGLVNLLVQYDMARESRGSWVPWCGVLVMTVTVVVSHGSPVAVAWDIATAAGVALGSGLAFRRSRRDSAPTLWPVEGTVEPNLYGPAELDVTIVVPFYNPGPALRRNLFHLLEVLRGQRVTFEIITVSDGCTDGSEMSIVGIEPGLVRQVVLQDNRGKGLALRTGLSQGRGRYLGFIDADGDLDAKLWQPFVELTRLYEPTMVLGSKRHSLSQVDCSVRRRFYSWGYQLLVRGLFRLPVRDTQTGIKLVRRDVLAEVLPRMVEDRFAFDLELLAVAHRLGYRGFFEAPVCIDRQFGSTVSARAVWRTFIETLGVAYRLHIARDYDRPLPKPRGEDGRAAVSRIEERPLRVLLCNWKDTAHPAAGGAEFYTQEVMQRWAAAGHEVTLFCSAVTGQRSFDELNGVRIVRRGGRYGVYSAARAFYAQRAGTFDVVVDEINTRPFGCATWVGEVPVVALIHQLARDVWFQEFSRPVAALGRYVLEPWWLDAYRDIPAITVSKSSAASLERAGLRRVSVVPPGVSLPALLPRPHKDEAPTIVFLGRLARNKQPDHALAAFRQVRLVLPSARLWVIGRGPLEGRLHAGAHEGVTFFGRVDEDEKFELLARAHALVVTSVREGWGLVVDEAAAVGTPAVAYEVAGLVDSVPAAGGVLVDPNPSALAAALISVLPAWVACPREAGRPGGARPWDVVAADVLGHLRQAVGSAPGATATPVAPSARVLATRGQR